MKDLRLKSIAMTTLLAAFVASPLAAQERSQAPGPSEQGPAGERFCVSRPQDLFTGSRSTALTYSVATGTLLPAPECEVLTGDAQSSEERTKSSEASTDKTAATPLPQPKRILGVMPNFRAVSAGAVAPPPTSRQALLLATENSFDYSAFIFNGFTSAVAEWTGAHRELGEGMAGYGRYYWRGFVDRTDGNYWSQFILPTVFRQDERYFTRGKGGFWKRFGYSVSRVVITPNYKGHDSFNVSELLGRGIAQGISETYYPGRSTSAGDVATRYGYAILRDALTNVFREFWPDMARHLGRRRTGAGEGNTDHG